MPTTRSAQSPRRRRRPTRSGVVLSEDLIVRTAMRLIEDPDGSGFSIRGLGRALGADPSAVYRYFRDAEDLMAAVTDEMIGDSMVGFSTSDDWRADLRDFGRRIYGHALLHPRLALLGTSRVSLRPHEFRAVDIGIGLLLSAGFAPHLAVRGYHAFVDLTLGFASIDAAARARGPEPDAAWTATYETLPAADYPHLAAARPYLASMTGSAYATAADVYLAGLGRALPSGDD